MVIKKFEEPKKSPIKFVNLLRIIRVKNKYRAVCWEIRRLEDTLLLNIADDYKVAVRKNLNYLKSQRKLILRYIN